MRLLDHEEPIDPDIAATLEAIDAVLAGDPVDAEYAELAEIALLVSAERPPVPPAFAQSIDQRVARRFTRVASELPQGPRRRRRRVSTGFWQASGAVAVGLAMIVGLVVLVGSVSGNGSSSAFSTSSMSSAASSAASSAGSTAGSSAPSSAAGSAAASAPAYGNARTPLSAQSAASAAPGTSALQPPTTGRKVVQSAQLQLAAAPDRIDDVAQQVYDVIGSVNGIVDSSTVTQAGGLDGYASFQLSVPSGALAQAMTRLSSLDYASVLSRTDATQDITDSYDATQRALSDARALRTSLLKQLASATTTEQVDSLNAQIHDAEASISSDQATLARLSHQVGFSSLTLQISPRTPAPVAPQSGGFGIGRAAHDAGRVLTVAAGVALIAIAGLTPVALVVALGWWVGAALRRRRREQALDSV